MKAFVIGLTSVCLLLLWVSWIASFSIRAAYAQISAIRDYWHARFPREERDPPKLGWWWFSRAPSMSKPTDDQLAYQQLPPITGHFKRVRWLQSESLPFSLAVVDFLVMAGGIFMLIWWW